MNDDSDDRDFTDYDSGPYCRHWGDPSDCEEKCSARGHRCGFHYLDSCNEIKCACTGWKEEK